MQRLMVLVLLPFMSRVASAEDTMVEMSHRGHAAVVEPYLKALADAAIPLFDEAEAMREAARLFTDRPPAVRDEFESQQAFQVRVDAIVSHNQAAARQRSGAVEERGKRHATLVSESIEAMQRADKQADQHHKSLYLMYRTTAPRYDIDIREFPELPIPDSRLGQASYGLADMRLESTNPGSVACSDLNMARKIREVSDNGHLWVILELRNARMQIVRESETIKRGAVERGLESLAKSAPEIALRLIAEYFNPGSTQNIPTMPPEVSETKTVPKVTVHISAEAARYHSLYDERIKKEFVVFE